MNHVIVFGDSLSDIGRKWKTKLGGFAAWKSDGELRLLNTSATGRFSDSKNWTDYMFEAASGQSLVSESLEGTIRASGEYHRLSSRWVNPPGAPRFRYANYAVGGAVGWKAAVFKNKVGLTTFSDQVDEFEADFAAVPGGGLLRNFLFIIMFGANDIYTDEKDSNCSADIGAGIVKQCDRLATLLDTSNGRLDNCVFVIAGAAYPSQSIYYTSQLESLKVQEAKELRARGNAIKANRGLEEMLASVDEVCQPRKDYERKVASLHSQVATLNRCLKSHCQANAANYHYFSMRVALLALQTKASALGINPNKAQTLAQYNKISPGRNWFTEKTDYIHFHNENSDALKVDGLFPLFTADQKHPTSRGYKALWDDMEALLKSNDLGFGNLVQGERRKASTVTQQAYWQKDSEVHTCQKCQVKFSFTTRRHHCRKCGSIFCDKCSKHKATLDNPLTEKGPSGKQGVKDCRVCDKCYADLGR
jgi:phospholipase/lecithinase/hemolysin